VSEDHTQVGTRTFTEWAYDAADQLVTENRGGQVTTFGFDQAGNQELEVATAGGRTSYVWDSENRLRQLLLPTGARNTMEYRWDALRHRLHDSEGDKLQVWDPLGTSGYQDLLEENIAGTALRRYYRGLLLSTLQDLTIPALRWYHFDHLGTTQALTDATSAVTDRWVGNAWGSLLSGTALASGPTRYKANSGYYSPEPPAHYYVRARYVVPEIARWMTTDQVDPLRDYLYARNGPTAHLDPSGNLVVLVRGGTGNPAVMGPLASYLATTYREAVFQPTYTWQIVLPPPFGIIPMPSPPTPPIVVGVLNQILAWATSNTTVSSDPCDLWLYGHAYGGHIVGQIASSTDASILAAKQRIIAAGFRFRRHVVATVDAVGYPAHFTGVQANLYTLAGDPTLIRRWDLWTETAPIIGWWKPSCYNTRGLNAPACYLSGGIDHVIQKASTINTPIFVHISFDGSSGIQDHNAAGMRVMVTGTPYDLVMRRFIARHLMVGHP
jgi:RHS repeat-associated protein